jgi:ribonuclease HI
MARQHIIQWNCRGLRANFDEIQILIQNFQPLVFSLQETLISHNNTINFRQYTHFLKNPIPNDTRPSGGVSLLIRKNIPHSQIKLNTNIQAVAATISLYRTITVCSIYLPPHSALNIAELEDLYRQLPSPVLLMGDFNAHSPVWGSGRLDAKGRLIENFIANENLCILNKNINTYVHPATGSQTAIDLTICNPALLLDFEWQVHDDLCGSDHFPILISNTKASSPTAIIRHWKLDKADWVEYDRLCKELLNASSILAEDDPIDAFTNVLINIASQTIPRSGTSVSCINKPWFNNTCKITINKRKATFRRYDRCPTELNLKAYKIQRAKTRQIIRAAKKASWQTYVSQLNSQTPSKKVWDMVRAISGKTTNTVVKHLTHNNTLITDVEQITNTLADVFASNSCTQHYTHKFQQYKTNAEKRTINFKSDNLEDYNIPFSMAELQESLDTAKNTSPGPDEVHYELLRHLPLNAMELLLSIFNLIFTTGNFPSSWRQAIVVPIPKPGKDDSDPSNYRPIALTSCVCKTMERMINNRLIFYLEQNGILTHYQSGFRKQRSTTEQLIRLDTWVREGLANGEHVVALFFDLEKAYDTTWKYGILSDLFKAGLKGRLPQFISQFLEGREFRVRIGSTLSDSHPQEMGVPQGSILSVTLFNLKINSIVSCLTTGVKCSLYVDDFLACCRSRQMRSTERQLQRCLNNLQNWCDENGFKFSQSKTVCMHFCHKRKLHPDPVLTLNNVNIPIVTEAKFLGLFFDNKLSYVPHLKYIRAKCLKSMNLLRLVAHKDWGGDCQTLLTLYRCIIRSKLDYGAVVYGAARKSYTSMLDPIQNQALRICLGAFRTSPVESLQVEANEPSLAQHRNKLSVLYALKLASNIQNPAYKCTFFPQYLPLFERKPKTVPTFGIRILKLLRDINIDFFSIAPYRIPSTPMWTSKKPTVSFSMQIGYKATINPEVLKHHFWELLETYQNFVHLYTDGSKEGCQVSAAMIHNRDVIHCRLPDNSSIFSAESRAIIMALDFADTHAAERFVIFSDSLSVLQTIHGAKWSNPLIREILEKCHFLSQHGKEIHLCWVPSHVGIAGNERADAAAKSALQLTISDFKIPHSDYKQLVKSHFNKIWQIHWDNAAFNKLQLIKGTLGITKLKGVFKRRDELVLHRARIGHTHLTHCFLLKNEDQPQCISCQCSLSVEHLLLKCSDFNAVRRKYFDVNSLKELFTTVPNSTILSFLRETGLYPKF